MKEQLSTMKKELKLLAKQIKQLKPEHRNSQREYSLFQNANREALSSKGFWESPIGKEYVSLSSKSCTKQSMLKSAKSDFRTLHIAYCMLRGRTIEQIEPVGKKPRSNPPDMKHVMLILKEVQNAMDKA